MITRNQPTKKSQRGTAAIEFSIILPLLLLIIAGIYELTQLLQANHVIVSLSREGANLISRSSTSSPEQVMDMIATTSEPIDLGDDGIMYISTVVGREDEDPYLFTQHRWLDHGFDASSSVWDNCQNWNADGSCEIDDPPTLGNFPLSLEAGESTYVVEVIYNYEPAFTFFFDANFAISDVTYL